MTIIELKNIGLKIGAQQIIDKISLQLKRGKVTTLIGPNCGGKTSIARILLGILKPSSGEVIRHEKIKIGYMPQKIEIEKTIPLTALDFIKIGNEKFELNNDLANRLRCKEILSNSSTFWRKITKNYFFTSASSKPRFTCP